jgi:hypothetical protein
MEKKSKAILASLKKLNGTAIAAIDTFTPVKLTGGKKNAMQGKIYKKVTGSNIMFFCNLNSNGYENMVNRRLEQEGKEPFTLSPRVWGERVTGTPFVSHKGSLYVEAIFLKAPTKITYYLDDQEIDKSDIIGLPEKSEGDQGGLDNKVVIRTYHIENITSLKMGDLSVI